jgi:hypothetical protein
VGFLGLALFVAGPQLGCLDTNNDGHPDVPVVLARAATIARASVSLSKYQPVQRLQNPPDITTAVVHPPSLVVERREPNSRSGRTALQSFCVFRC